MITKITKKEYVNSMGKDILPTIAFFETKRTLVKFQGDIIIDTVSTSANNATAHMGLLIAMAKLYFPRIEIRKLYPKDKRKRYLAEEKIKMLVFGFLSGRGIFNTIEAFNKWISDFIINHSFIKYSSVVDIIERNNR